MNSAHAEPLIVGYGNRIRGDDAIGLHVAEAAAAAGYHVIATPQLLPELAEAIAGAPRVVFVDCDVRLAPGQVRLSRPESTGGLHAPTSPAGLLELARDLYGHSPPAIAIGVGPANLELSETLSPVVEAAIATALYQVKRLSTRRSAGCASGKFSPVTPPPLQTPAPATTDTPAPPPTDASTPQ